MLATHHMAMFHDIVLSTSNVFRRQVAQALVVHGLVRLAAGIWREDFFGVLFSVVAGLSYFVQAWFLFVEWCFGTVKPSRAAFDIAGSLLLAIISLTYL
eukprot:173537-Rhodomonas_salina.1